MNISKFQPLALCWFVGAAFSVHALAAPDAPPKLSLGKPDVTDSRDSDGGTLVIRFEVKSPALARTRAVRASVVSALDGDGHPLCGPDAPKKEVSNPFAGQFDRLGSYEKDGTTISLYLPSPPRSNTQVRSVQGELEMVQPDNDPSSVVVVEDFRRLTGKPLALPFLRAHSISIVMWTKAQYEQRKKAAASNLKSALSQGIDQMFSGLFGNSKAADSVAFQIKDPHLRLVDIQFEDAKGRSLGRGSSWQGYPQDVTRTFDFDKKLPPDARIKITVATDKSRVKVPFELSDVPLP